MNNFEEDRYRAAAVQEILDACDSLPASPFSSPRPDSEDCCGSAVRAMLTGDVLNGDRVYDTRIDDGRYSPAPTTTTTTAKCRDSIAATIAAAAAEFEAVYNFNNSAQTYSYPPSYDDDTATRFDTAPSVESFCYDTTTRPPPPPYRPRAGPYEIPTDTTTSAIVIVSGNEEGAVSSGEPLERHRLPFKVYESKTLYRLARQVDGTFSLVPSAVLLTHVKNAAAEVLITSHPLFTPPATTVAAEKNPQVSTPVPRKHRQQDRHRCHRPNQQQKRRRPLRERRVNVLPFFAYEVRTCTYVRCVNCARRIRVSTHVCHYTSGWFAARDRVDRVRRENFVNLLEHAERTGALCFSNTATRDHVLANVNTRVKTERETLFLDKEGSARDAERRLLYDKRYKNSVVDDNRH